MSLLRRAERRSVSSATPERYLQEMQAQRLGGAVPMVSTESDSLAHSAVWAGTFLYADLISTLPFIGYRDVNGSPVRLPSQPKILTDPSVSVPPIDWRAQVVTSLILRGNAWGTILTRDQFGYPTTIELEHPDCIKATWERDRLRKRIWIDGTEVNPEDVWHCAINVLPGTPFGLSMIAKARQAIYGGVAAASYSNQVFAAGGHPTAILKSDAPLGPNGATELQDRFDERLAQRRGRVMVMQGLEYVPIQINPKDSQFLDAMKASVSDVARFLRLPVELLGGESGNSMTYSNVESRAVDLLRYSIDPVLVRLEAALTRSQPQPQYTKATRAALLRMTTKERYEAHHIALDDGWQNVDGVRALEELPPLPDGEGQTYRKPQAASPAQPSQVAP